MTSASDCRRVYLDYNATTPVDPEVVSVITEAYHTCWGNPSSSYCTGKQAKELIEKARHQIALMIGSQAADIIFTSGGTESNNLVIHSAIEEYVSRKENKNSITNGVGSNALPHIITTNIEHDSVKLPIEHLQEKNIIDATFVPVSKQTGYVEPDDIIAAIKPSTCLVTVMLANNETGIIQPVAEISREVNRLNKERQQKGSHVPCIWMHSDASQAIGKIEVNVNELGVDFLTVTGHKFYGPRIGALYCKQSGFTAPKIHPMLFGGGQERSFRPGTENTPLIAGLGKAAELVTHQLDKYAKHMKNTCSYLEDRLIAAFGDKIHFNGKREGAQCLPNTCSIAFSDCDLIGIEILENAKIIEASVGAACHKSLRLSAILLASGISEKLAATTLRLSVGRETSKEDIDLAVNALRSAIKFNKT